MINPTPATLEDILNTSLQFVVPQYQRDYTWGSNEALEFLEDLKDYAHSDSEQLFLGTIIFDVSDRSHRCLRIVDGQQRLTTVMILLIACRMLAKRLGAHDIATLIQQKITFQDPATAESLGPRLLSSESVKDIFGYMARNAWEGDFPARIERKQIKRQVNRVKPTYDSFFEEIKDFGREELSAFLRALYKTYVVRIEIEGETEAFSIFERTNARGTDLEASDLLKNYLFSQQLENLEERWPQIVENSGGTLLRMLKYFYTARNGYVAKPDLYKRIRAYAEDLGAVRFVDDLGAFSVFYSAMRSANREGIAAFFESIGYAAIAADQDKYERIYYPLEGLRLFKVTQAYPLIYAALECYGRSVDRDTSPRVRKLIGLFELFERYHFVNNAVCDRIGNEVEKLYADFCVKYVSSNDFEATTLEFAAALRDKLATEAEFSSRFVDISYADSLSLVCYIFDRINNVRLAPGQRLTIFNPDPRLLRRNHNIEHFYPRRPADTVPTDSRTLEVVDNIGNLLAISFRTNSRLSNLSPLEKMTSMRGPLSREIRNVDHVQEFIDKYGTRASSWNADAIALRARELAEQAYRTVWPLT